MGTVCVYFSVTNLSVDRSGCLRDIEALTAASIDDEQKGQTLETNRRPASPLDAGWKFERAIYDTAFLSGGGRSAFCSA